MDVNDKVALVTGGAGGIGLAMVKKLLESGATGVSIVDICDKPTVDDFLKEFEEKYGKGKAIYIRTDVTVSEELENAFETTVKFFDQLDIVVNNAGIVDESDWKQTINVNLIAAIEGTYLALERYLPHYMSEHEGVVVNTSSVLGLTTIQIAPSYCASKHGLVGFGKAVGGKDFYNKYKVRVLTLCPGLVHTPLITGEKGQIHFPQLVEVSLKSMNAVAQTADIVGEALIDIIQKGKSGSLWITEEGRPIYEILEPSRNDLKA